jgi:hypothetical protein
MTAKSHHRRPFIGEWCLVEMALWDRADLDLLGPAYLTLDRRGQGTMRFLAIEAGVDYRPAVRDGQPAIEFSFEGNDEGDRISGRGWAELTSDTLRGHVYFHDGDDSSFRATRGVIRRRRSPRPRTR